MQDQGRLTTARVDASNKTVARLKKQPQQTRSEATVARSPGQDPRQEEPKGPSAVGRVLQDCRWLWNSPAALGLASCLQNWPSAPAPLREIRSRRPPEHPKGPYPKGNDGDPRPSPKIPDCSHSPHGGFRFEAGYRLFTFCVYIPGPTGNWKHVAVLGSQ